jgi:hypothetical protein
LGDLEFLKPINLHNNMKLSKDESAILAVILSEGKYEFNNSLNQHKKEDSVETMRTIETLEKKLQKAGTDYRRLGRTSQNSTTDILKRLKKKYN